MIFSHNGTSYTINDNDVQTIDGLEFVGNGYDITKAKSLNEASWNEKNIKNFLALRAAINAINIPDVSGFATKQEVSAIKVPDISGLAAKSDIPDVSGFATKQDLNDLTNKPFQHSFGEVKTNELWINGKPIYRNFYNVGTKTGAFLHGILDIDEFVRSPDFVALCVDGWTYGNSWTDVQSNRFRVNRTYFSIGVAGGVNSASHVVLYYTKLTDTATS